MPANTNAPFVPTIDTPRLVLRGHRADDLAACHALWSDPLVTKYIGGKPSTLEEVWARLVRYVGHWALLGFGYWVVHERESGAFVGEVGLADFRRTITPSIAGLAEAGWVLVPSAQGKGYATEAVQAALAWHESQFGRTRTACLIDPANAASLRVADKCGYLERVATTYHGSPTLLLYR